MTTTRREFLAHTTGSAALVASGFSLPGFLGATARAAGDQAGERVLVIVQLTGGNDGLNTVIPCTDDRYHRARPTLRINENEALRLNDDLGLHPAMSAMHDLYNDGCLGVITNVGYPNPDRSHFRSMDIWHSCASQPETVDTGWIGRLADRHDRPGKAPFAVHLDNAELPLAVLGEQAVVPSISNIEALRLADDAGSLKDRIATARRNASDDLRFVQRVAVASCEQAARLEHIFDDGDRAAAYPPFPLAGRLRQIAQLISAGFGARVYYTSLGGFDTHARQELSHGPLLRQLSDSVAAFQRDLQQRGLDEHVTLMTFSEFGRRVNENGSRGTDHGAAAPMFIVGRNVRPGVHGNPPDLGRLVEGDVAHDTDFRQVYTTMLRLWLDIDAVPVLGGRYSPLDLLI